jgi:hypothetical protein
MDNRSAVTEQPLYERRVRELPTTTIEFGKVWKAYLAGDDRAGNQLNHALAIAVWRAPIINFVSPRPALAL